MSEQSTYGQDDYQRVLQELSDEELEENYDFLDNSDGEEENILVDNYSSDSEQSADEDIVFPEVRDCDFSVFMGKDQETFWLSNSLALPKAKTPSRNIVKTLPGPTRVARDAASEIDCFLKFISINMIDEIVLHTNQFIESKRELVKEKKLAEGKEYRDRDYKLTDRAEIMALIGLLIILSVRKGNRANARISWNSDGTGMLVCRAIFSYNRFALLLQALRFDDRETRSERQQTDKLAAIRSIYEQFNKNCKESYCLSEYVTIDEMLHPFRGRCGFVQYMPAKPAKYGLKLYALCDSKTFYTFNFEVYCGTQFAGPFAVSNKPEDVVKRLVQPIMNTNRNLTTDNYYSSYPLAMYLLDNGITFTGTMKKNKREIPPEFLANRQRPVRSSLFGFQDNCTLVSFVPKKNKSVLLLSTMDNVGKIDIDTGKPEMILHYNSTKGGVDTVDQKCSAYSTARNTRRWPLSLFFRFLDMAGVNSHVIYVANNYGKIEPEKFRRSQYLHGLAFGLLETNFKSRAMLKNLPTDIQLYLSSYRESGFQAAAMETELPNERKRGPCHECGKHKNNNTTIRCFECKKFVCKNHSKSLTTCRSCELLQ